MPQLYDEIGVGYRAHRRPDPRFAARILDALAGTGSVVNVGAGAGSYEPADRPVVAVEPALTMIRQRPPGSAPVVRASASHLPFRDRAFDAALAVLTVHHWRESGLGLSELARVARDRVVVLTIDPTVPSFWLVEDYFPEIRDHDLRTMPSLAALQAALGIAQVEPLPVPHDCVDGFLGAYWRRPHAYLDAGVRGAISAFARIGDAAAGLARLRRDLESGAWERRHGHLLQRHELDLGYRLVVARRGLA